MGRIANAVHEVINMGFNLAWRISSHVVGVHYVEGHGVLVEFGESLDDIFGTILEFGVEQHIGFYMFAVVV